MIKSWLNYNEDQQKLRYRQNFQATNFYKTQLLKFHIQAWRQALKNKKLQEESNQRKLEIYQKVKDILPDFSY